MKYCPYCGAPLQDSAASFCSECGQKLVPVQEEGCSEQKKKRFPPFLRAKKQKQQALDPVVSEQEPAPPDDALLDAEADRNYDGYYDDILPTESGQKERTGGSVACDQNSAALRRCFSDHIRMCCGAVSALTVAKSTVLAV